MVSQASKREWGNLVTRLALAPVLAVGGWAMSATFATAQAPDLPTPIAAVRQPDPLMAKGSTDVETVRQLVKDGRAALHAGDRAKAEKLARQAAAMKVALPFWENDTPEKLLIDIGVTAGGVLGWAVFAPTQGAPADALAGEYVGASGDIGLGFGAGVNVLMGGSGRTFALQPVSLEGSVGVNVALGVSGLKLRAVY